jgi:hypothetical protein
MPGATNRAGFGTMTGAINPRTIISPTAPAVPKNKDIWINSTAGVQSQQYWNGSAWVSIGVGSAGIGTIITDDVTVINFKMANVTKMTIGIVKNKDNVDTPLLVMGAGDGYGNNRGYIQKDTDGLSLYYVGTLASNEVSYIKLMKDKIVYGSGNATPDMEIFIKDTGNKLAGSYISDAGTWNAKINEAEMKVIVEDPAKVLAIPKENILSVYAQNILGSSISTTNWTGGGDNYIYMSKQLIYFKESTLTKMAMGFLPNKDNVQTPLIVMGAGDGYGSNRGYIQKDADGVSLYYIGNLALSEVSYLKLTKDKVSVNGYDIFSTASTIGDSYLTSGSDWTNKLQKMDTSGQWRSTATGTARVELLSTGIYGKNASNQNNGLYVDPTTSDLILYYNNAQHVKFWNELNGITSMYIQTNRIGYGSSTGFSMAGSWDFTNATLTGTKKIHVGTSAPLDTSGGTIWIDTN